MRIETKNIKGIIPVKKKKNKSYNKNNRIRCASK